MTSIPIKTVLPVNITYLDYFPYYISELSGFVPRPEEEEEEKNQGFSPTSPFRAWEWGFSKMQGGLVEPHCVQQVASGHTHRGCAWVSDIDICWSCSNLLFLMKEATH